MVEGAKYTYNKAIDWVKKSATDDKQSEKVKALAKKNAEWAQKKLTLLKKEIQLDVVEEQKAA